MEFHQLHTILMGFTQWQMDNHMESLQGEMLSDRRLLSGEKLQASRLQDFLSGMGPKTLQDPQSMRFSGQCTTICYAERKLKVCATDLKKIHQNNTAFR